MSANVKRVKCCMGFRDTGYTLISCANARKDNENTSTWLQVQGGKRTGRRRNGLSQREEGFDECSKDEQVIYRNLKALSLNESVVAFEPTRQIDLTSRVGGQKILCCSAQPHSTWHNHSSA